MRVLIESPHEAAIFEDRFRAIAHQLGPTVEVEAVLPDGQILRKPLGGLSKAAQVASLNEWMEDRLARQSFGSR